MTVLIHLQLVIMLCMFNVGFVTSQLEWWKGEFHIGCSTEKFIPHSSISFQVFLWVGLLIEKTVDNHPNPSTVSPIPGYMDFVGLAECKGWELNPLPTIDITITHIYISKIDCRNCLEYLKTRIMANCRESTNALAHSSGCKLGYGYQPDDSNQGNDDVCPAAP